MTWTRSRGFRAAVRSALSHHDVRRLVAVWGLFHLAEAGEWLAVTTVAYHFGGIREASLVVVLQLAPAAVAATMIGRWSVRWGSRRVLIAGLTVQAVGMGGAGVLIAAGAHPWTVYALAVVAATGMVAIRPAVMSLLPFAVVGPLELTATNVALGWLDAAAALVGPAITAVSIAVGGFATPLFVFATVMAAATVVAATVTARPDRPGISPEPLRATVAALSEVVRSPGSRSALVILAAHAFVIGALDLLFVVVAVDVLRAASAGAGWMSSAFGLGSVVGSVIVAAVITRRHVWQVILVGSAVLCASLAVLGRTPGVGSTLVVFVLCGAGAAALLVSTRTLLQRLAPLRLLVHTFSLVETAESLMLLIGTATVPLMVSLLGDGWAPAGIAALAAAGVLTTIGALARAEQRAIVPSRRIEQLRSVDVLALLSPPALESLAREAELITCGAGTDIITEGEVGNRYYVLISGRVEVRRGGEVLDRLGPGCGIGEYALLRDAPRSATVTAEQDCELLAVEGADFLAAVVGNPSAFAHLDLIADQIQRTNGVQARSM